MGKLDGKVALVTGGARGMGASHVRTFVAEGAKVVFGDVREDDGSVLAKELGEGCRFVSHDVTDEDMWDAAVSTAREAFGSLDILVNNAGILAFQPIAESTVEAFRRFLDVNLVSQWIGIKAAVPAMGDGGSIVNISSINGLVGGQGLTGYSASKFGVAGLTKSAALELGPRRIRVNSVHPGGVATAMIGREEGDVEDRNEGPMSRIPIPRYGRLEEVSKLVLYLASDDSSFCTGSAFVIDGGMTAGAGF